MHLPFTGETITNPENGESYKALDVSCVDFSKARLGRKTAETIVRKATGSEVIETRNAEGKLETSYVTQPGDAIFQNIHDARDTYVPGKPEGGRWQFYDIEKMGYEITQGSLASGAVRVIFNQAVKILPEAIQENVCIKDAWGKGQHQYLYKGATLKITDNGIVVGIDKSAFDATWEILPKPPKSRAAQRRRKLKP